MGTNTPDDQSWSIYTLHDPRDPVVIRYVGFTVDVEKRKHTHIIKAINGRDKTLCGLWKKSLLVVGVEPSLTVIETGKGPSWEEAERRWIKHFREVFGDLLLNMASGGCGPTGARWTLKEDTKLKMGIASKLRGFSELARKRARESLIGKPITDEHRKKLSEAHTGLKRTPESIEKTAAFWRGHNHSEETKEKMRKVHQKIKRLDKPVDKQECRTEASRLKTSEALKNYYAKNGTRKLSQEARRKISESIKKYRNPETPTAVVQLDTENKDHES